MERQMEMVAREQNEQKVQKVRGFEKAILRKTVDEAGNEVVEYWDSTIPNRSTAKAAGYDFYAAEDINIPSIWGPLLTRMFIRHTEEGKSENESHRVYLRKNYSGDTPEEKEEAKSTVRKKFAPILVHTGIKAYMPDDEMLCLYNRSGNPKKLGLVLANSVGIIDSDYYGNEDNDGEIMFAFYNFFPFTITIPKGTRIGQGIFQKFLKADGDNAFGERKGGFGSTGGIAIGGVRGPGGPGGVVGQNFDFTGAAMTAIAKAQEFVEGIGNQVENAVNQLSTEVSDSLNGMNTVGENVGEDFGHLTDAVTGGTSTMGGFVVSDKKDEPEVFQ